MGAFNMLSIEEATRILNDPSLTDTQVEEIRDGFRDLAELIFDAWQEKIELPAK